MKTTNQFIESQQELARELLKGEFPLLSDPDFDWHASLVNEALDKAITTIIKNTGEEILCKCNKEIKEADKFVPFQAIHYKSGIDTLKKHITSLIKTNYESK